MEWTTLTISLVLIMLAFLVWCCTNSYLAIRTMNKNMTLLRIVTNDHTQILYRIEQWQLTTDGRIENIEKRLNKTGV